MKKSVLLWNALLYIFLTSFFIYSLTLPKDSQTKKIFIIFASVSSILYSMLLFSTLSFFIIVKLKSYDHMERWIRDLRRMGLTSNLRLYDLLKEEIHHGHFTIENVSTFFLFMKGQNTKTKKDFNKKIVMNSILNFEASLKNGFKINKNETLKNKLEKHKIRLTQKEFNEFTLYFLFEIFTKYGKYIERDDIYFKYMKKIM